jgi:excisionase family DNA binding protein
MEDNFVTIKQLADTLHVTRKTIGEWMKEGKVTYVRVEKRVLFNLDQIISDHTHPRTARTRKGDNGL